MIQTDIEYVINRKGENIKFEREKITLAIYKAAASVGGHDKALSEKLTNDVIDILNKQPSYKSTATIEEVQDIIEKVLIENGHAKTAKAHILYRAERAKIRELKNGNDRAGDNLPYKTMWERLMWNIDHNCETVAKINNHIENNTFKELILKAEDEYNKSIERAAEAIIDSNKNVKCVIIAGPSSSGKTTTTIKLGNVLRKNDKKLVAINLDNYFFDLHMHPKDEFGDYDFETPEALDLGLINEHLENLIQGNTIMMPKYNFKTGKREEKRTSLKLESNEILLIDNLHGLYKDMTKVVKEEQKFRIYIETLSQQRDKNKNFIRWTDIRLLRRMIRDSKHRNFDPKRTLEHWHYVRRAELKHIVPYISTADFVINGSLPYELAVLKPYLLKYFPEFIKEYKSNTKRQDAYIRSKRIFELLNEFKDFTNIEWIPENSLIREFIGDSSYQY